MRIKTLQIREEKNMKQSVRRIAAWIMVMLLLCPAVSALAEGAEESAPAANTAEPAPQETAEPTERPKVSAAELQSQGILTVGAKGDEVTKGRHSVSAAGSCISVCKRAELAKVLYPVDLLFDICKLGANSSTSW